MREGKNTRTVGSLGDILEAGYYYGETALLFEKKNFFMSIFVKCVIHVPAIENGVL